MARYREGKIKREHGVPAGILALLRRVAEVPEIEAIIPGRIHRRPGSAGTELRFQYFTESGLKLLAKHGGAVQEVFLVAAAREEVLAALVERGLVRGEGPGAGPAEEGS